MKLIKNLGAIKKDANPNNRSSYGIFLCPICSNEFTTRIADVKNGSSTKCSSCSNRISKTKHGYRKTRLYSIWSGMKDRCNNPKSVDYKNYGARGFEVCFEWNTSFEKFRDWALENGYTKDLSLDRRNGNTGYRPQNCRWATKSTQAQNIKQCRVNNTSGYKGVSYSKVYKKFVAYINVDKKRKHLGYFLNAIDGAKAYNKYVLDNKLEHTLNNIGE